MENPFSHLQGTVAAVWAKFTKGRLIIKSSIDFADIAVERKLKGAETFCPSA